MIDISALENAVSQLQQGLELSENMPDNELMRDGVIQRFEYTYELTWKMLKRYLEDTEASRESVDSMSFQEIIRTSSERGLVMHGWDVWASYRKARGTTSHVYDAAKAQEVFEVIPQFLDEARFAREVTSQRQSNP